MLHLIGLLKSSELSVQHRQDVAKRLSTVIQTGGEIQEHRRHPRPGEIDKPCAAVGPSGSGPGDETSGGS